MGALGLIATVFLVACAATPSSEDPPATEPAYRDVVQLFERGIARTCALNNGVCHNSNSYPDLHTVSTVIGTIGRACNVDVATPAEIHDACEPAADHLVIPSAGIDARIVRAALAPDGLSITLTLDPPPDLLATMATDTEVHRGTTRFAVGAKVLAVAGPDVELELRTTEARRFFDLEYPLTALQLHVGDPNGNGVEGAIAAAMPLIAPGNPDGSYMLRRLVDASYGELMPRQCRTWDDRANHALACWIAGLAADGSNAYEPIDYASCTYDVTGLGKCETVVATGYAGVEQIFARSCGGTGCHVGEEAPAGKLDLSPGNAYAQLVGTPSLAVRMDRVAPGDPDASYLWCKVAGTCAARQGARMPLDAPALDDVDLETIREWIAAGAPR